MTVSIYFGNELPDTPPVEIDTSSPFRILVLADLGAEKEWGKPIFVDRDELNDVIKNFGVTAEFELSGDHRQVMVGIESVDDFHPDQLFKKVGLFQALRAQRSRIENPATFQQEIQSSRPVTSQETSAEDDASNTNSESQPSGSSILSSAIDLSQSRQPPLEQQVLQGMVDWDAYVRQLATPFLVAKPDPRQEEMLENIDQTITTAMRELLHHPRFQQLEATWTGIQFLTQRLETGRTLQIEILNVSEVTLQNDLQSNDDLTQSRLYELLVKRPEAQQLPPWSLVIGDYQFETNSGLAALLGRIARISAAAGSPFLAGATSDIAGCVNFGSTPDCDDWTPANEKTITAWKELRALPESEFLCLTTPRILGRRPYGQESDPIDSFRFEELPDGTRHDDYLWINAAYGLAYLYGEAFSEAGWEFEREVGESVRRLPIHFFVDEGEECIKACAEAYLVDRSAEKLESFGLTVARSVKDEGEVRFEKVRSISESSPTWRNVSR